MADLFDAFEEGGRFEDQDTADQYYQNKQAPSDYTARLIECGIGVHDNKESTTFGQTFLALELEVIEGQAPLSTKVGAKQYDPVEGRPGDKFRMYFNLSPEGKKASAAKYIFKDVSGLAAVLEGTRPGDYSKEGAIGPKGLRDVFDDSGKHLGKVLRFCGQTESKGGYFNTSIELVPSDEPVAEAPKASKKGKAAA